jgi:N4-(beta-N-acetylglucosaminyl)-L-asparaginase
MISRRDYLLGSAGMAAASQVSAQGAPRNIVISSANGLAACKRAMEYLVAGRDTLDAVIAGVNIPEEDPEDNSVGYGGLPNEEGVVELDASVMHGPTRRAGSVASIRGIKTPSKIARLVMERSDHVMLVGEGALRFAKAHGFQEENLLTEKSRIAWLVWKEQLRNPEGHSNWSDGVDAPPAKSAAHLDRLKRLFPETDEQTLAWALDQAHFPTTGTINCLALSSKGEMSGTTTTSGLAWKIPGRVGDSPIIGAGLYVDQEVGGGGSTGRGEENIRVCGGHTIVENMRQGMSPVDACLDTLKRISRNFDHDKKRLAKFDITFYALRKDGAYASATLWSKRTRMGKAVPAQFSVNTGGESRLENCAYLYEREG